MSRRVREWLTLLGLLHLTTHEDRLEIDREIELLTGVNCDEAIEKGLIDIQEFKEIVFSILRKRRRLRELESAVLA